MCFGEDVAQIGAMKFAPLYSLTVHSLHAILNDWNAPNIIKEKADVIREFEGTECGDLNSKITIIFRQEVAPC